MEEIRETAWEAEFILDSTIASYCLKLEKIFLEIENALVTCAFDKEFLLASNANANHDKPLNKVHKAILVVRGNVNDEFSIRVEKECTEFTAHLKAFIS